MDFKKRILSRPEIQTLNDLMYVREREFNRLSLYFQRVFYA